MADKKPFYITTTLPYVNAEPHIGFAMEIIQADAIARWQELQGKEIFFNTGTDEHGQKVFKAAQDQGILIQDYVDQFALKFKELKETLNLHPKLHFVRTTDEGHVVAAQYLWKLCEKDIYKKKYVGLYCEGDEAFVRESDLVNGRCPNHPNLELQEVEEENYFFKLSNYKDKLRDYLSRDVVTPDWRRNEALIALEAMEDLSISREKARLSWGVPVPGDDTQVMYVWFDALTSYISTLGWPNDKVGNYQKFWVEGDTLQLAGKDQVKFQSIIWQAMLLSASLPNTKKVLYHGFITSEGHKMSKSLGNVINPNELVQKFGRDALRYYLLRHVSTFEDGDVTLESFKEAYNGNLANGLGNLVSRIMKLAEDNLSVPVVPEPQTIPKEFIEAMENFEIQKAFNIVWVRIGDLDRKIQDTKPWENKDERLISEIVLELYTIGRMLNPLLPETSKIIKDAIEANKKPDNLFPRLA